MVVHFFTGLDFVIELCSLLLGLGHHFSLQECLISSTGLAFVNFDFLTSRKRMDFRFPFISKQITSVFFTVGLRIRIKILLHYDNCLHENKRCKKQENKISEKLEKNVTKFRIHLFEEKCFFESCSLISFNVWSQ